MKKSIIKYLVIFVIIITIISFTGYNLDTEPHNIKVIKRSSIHNYNYTFPLKYVNLTYGNSRAEYVLHVYYNPEVYPVDEPYYTGSVYIYKLNQKTDFPVTGIAVEIKNVNINITKDGIRNGYVGGICKTQYYNDSIFAGFPPVSFCSSGNSSISVSFSIVPVYNMYIYHFNGKEQHFHYNFTLRVSSQN